LRTLVLDIDGSIASQPGFGELLAKGAALRLDLRSEERALRLWTSASRLFRLRERIADAMPPGRGPVVTFYGSGDYHHIVTALIQGFADPLTVVHFDNHPDWVRFPPTHNCGGWVNRVLALPQVRRVVTLGVSSADLQWPQLKSGNIAALASGQLEVHPWRAEPSRVWGKIGDGQGHRRRGRWIEWNCLADRPWPEFVDALAARLPTRAVWLTIDKDVLRPEDAATNWDQGGMPLASLLAAVERIAAACDIVGVDVCGDYSVPRFSSPAKLIAAWLDRHEVAPPRGAEACNDRTNRALLATFARVLP
jgi:hypothetical protein